MFRVRCIALLLLLLLWASAHAQEVLLGELSQLEHDVSGKVYIVDDRTLRIDDFTYDGLGPSAVFWFDRGGEASADGVGAPDRGTCAVPDRLPRADGDEFVVEVPDGERLQDFGYFSVWCRAVNSEFGGIELKLDGLDIAQAEPQCSEGQQEEEEEQESAPVLIGELSMLQHDVSGSVFALNNRQLRITGLNYDGLGPAALFWVGTGSPDGNGQGVPFKDSCEIDEELPRYNDDTVELELPDGLTLSDIDYLSIWCERFAADFGNVRIDADQLEGVPELDSGNCSGGGDQEEEEEAVEPFPVPEGWNCESLNEDFQVRWLVDGDDIKFELVSRGLGTDRYMGFGPSGSDSATRMVGSDVVIAYNLPSGPAALDYSMTTREPCNNGVGVCPDTMLSNPGSNDVSDVSGDTEGDLTRISFIRSLAAADDVDRPISTTGQTFVTWALGPLDESGLNLPLFHQGQTNYPQVNVAYEFGRPPVDQCTTKLTVQDEEEEPVPGFRRPTISGATEITARIGPPGGARGYSGITGGPSWGFAWYMSRTNTTGEDILIPAIALERGETYTFTIQGGVNNSGSTFHPFYITDSARGGYATITAEERGAEKVYAGIEDIVTENGAVVSFKATATGALCDITSPIIETDNIATWEEYAESLNVSCAEDPEVINNSGVLKFTVPDDAPDVLYYQCVTHQLLGFKFVIFDKGEVDQAELERQSGGGDLEGNQQERSCIVTFGGQERTFSGCRENLSGGVDLYWTIREQEGEIDTLFRAPTNGGYVGFGWGHSSMVPGTAVIAYAGGDGEAVADNYALNAQSPEGVQPGSGNEYMNIDAAIDGEYVAGFFTRKLDSETLPPVVNGETSAIWAVGPRPDSPTSLQTHTSRMSGSINLESGAVAIDEGLRPFFTAHASLMLISWLFLTPTAILVMTHLKGYNPLTFQLHRGINVLSVLVFIIAYIMGLVRGSRTQKAHLGLGSAVFVLALLQIIGGALRPHKGTPNRKPWYLGHAFLGTSAVILAVANAAVGIEKFRAGNSYWIAFGVLLGINAVGHVVLLALRSRLPEESKEEKVEKDNLGEAEKI